MKNIRTILLTTTVAVLLTTASCEKDENGNRITYYKTIGEGYIYERDNNKPLKGVKITVISSTSIITSGGTMLLGNCCPHTQETFTTDENGYYKIRFAKRIGNRKVETYRVELNPIPPLPSPPPFWYREANTPLRSSHDYMYVGDIKGKKIIIFDTVKYYPSR